MDLKRHVVHLDLCSLESFWKLFIDTMISYRITESIFRKASAELLLDLRVAMTAHSYIYDQEVFFPLRHKIRTPVADPHPLKATQESLDIHTTTCSNTKNIHFILNSETYTKNKICLTIF